MSSPIRRTLSVTLPAIAALILFPALSPSAAGADKKPAAAPAAHAAAPAAHAAAPATHAGGSAGTAAGHSTTTTAGHTTGATTAGHTTTTTSHTTTTTTTSHTTTTAGGHTTTTAGARPGTTAGGRPGGPASAGTARGGFGGHPTPAGAHVATTRSGATEVRRPNGQRSDLHDSRRGMDVHHSLSGNRRISVERADHSRVFAERGGRGFVQHPYSYHGREYGRRTYWDHGRRYDRFYGSYGYHGVMLDVYAPARFYPVGFYGWAYNPWAVPITYAWGWGAAPWYGVYGGYFAPYPVYPSAAFWLTDYLIANSLQAAYAAQAEANAQAAAAAAEAGAPPPAGGPPVLTPEIKAMIADEVKRQVALENAEATANAQKQDIDPGGSSIARLLSDNQVHVFVVGADLDLVTNPDGTECPVSQGDVLKIAEPPAADATSAYAIVLSSKSWRKECRAATAVSVALTDLQDMQNHMRETIDAGMGDLQAKQGQGGIPPAPPSAKAPPTPSAFAEVAPPPDPNVDKEIAEQTKAADQAEAEAGAPTSGPADASLSASTAAPAAAPATTTIAIGQTIAEVTASMGQPKRVLDLGTKKIYVYPDMKVTFKAGKVSDVE